ncbi:hypothetical protein ACROYT_G022256 [Oculina patagonica]
MPPVKSGRKNKRGERGSTDDETAEPKRVNMASADFEPEDSEEREDVQPDLADIHALLKDIQKSMNNLSREVAELKTSFKQQESELKTAKESLNAALKYNAQLKTELQATKNRVKELEVENDDLYENMDAIKRKKSNPIIMRFISHKVKRALYKQRVKLKNISGSQLFPSAPATARPSSNRIFINENLTAHRRNLVRMANDMKQDGILKGVWTVDGKIFVKTSPEGRPLRINTEDYLDEL